MNLYDEEVANTELQYHSFVPPSYVGFEVTMII
jgi:hypothetical protein